MDAEAEEKLLEKEFNDTLGQQESQDFSFTKDNPLKLKSGEDKKCEGELLGSVITINCPGVRTSARVIQKMKQDQIRPASPPAEKKDILKDEKHLLKTPTQTKSNKVPWTNIEKNLFFDALNEFGRDFDSIANFINSKLKRKSAADQGFKSKEHVRQTFYQTFHKITKFIKFSDEVKKPAQELYALINYGEMRRRLSFVSEKNLMKIKDLVYKGHATLRSKGKTVRIKTPSCKALRKLNQLEDWLEDIKLPSKVEVFLRPATMESWGRVQSLAQNPVVRTVVPLHKKLVNVIRTFQYRWRSHETKVTAEALKLIGSMDCNDYVKREPQIPTENEALGEPLLCFTPQQNAVIHRPLVSITEYLSSFNICLNSYEERIEVKVRGEMLCHEKHSTKRQRSDSGCEKKSPEHKKLRGELDRHSEFEAAPVKDEKDIKLEGSEVIGADIFTEAFCDLSADDKIAQLERQDSNDMDCIKNEFCSDGEGQKCSIVTNKEHDPVDSLMKNDYLQPKEIQLIDNLCKTEYSNKEVSKIQKKKDIKCSTRKKDRKELSNLRPLISDEVLQKIRKGWTILNCADITIGDLYVVFGQDSKLMFEYNWLNNHNKDVEKDQGNMVPYSPNNNESEQDEIVDQIRQSSLGSKLKQLLLIAHLNETVRKKPCYCGHTCERQNRSLINDLTSQSFISNKTCTSSHNDDILFRQPTAPFRRNSLTIDSFKRASNGLRYKPRKFGTFGSKQIVVKRLLPVQNGVGPEIEVKTVQNHFATIQRISGMDTVEDEEDEDDDDLDMNAQSVAETSETQENLNSEDENNTGTETNNGLKGTGVDLCNLETINENAMPSVEDLKDDNTVKNDIIFGNKTSSLAMDEVPDMSQLMDLSLSSALPLTTLDENTNDLISNIPAMSPMQLIRENTSSKWLEDNINDFSLSSFLGHLDEISSRDGSETTSNSLNDSSIDYMRKFAEIAASMQNEEKDV